MIDLEEAEKAFFNISDFEMNSNKLGEGGYGTVYTCKNKKDGKIYAIKYIKVHDKFDGKDQILLIRESMIHQQLKHPAIVPFKGINFQSSADHTIFKPSIITEYQSKGSLKTILYNEKHLLSSHDWTNTKKFITILGIANGMKYLHERGIIHRDLKPENVVCDDNYYPKICDFGLSRCLPKIHSKKNKQEMTYLIGTPLYMAPEMLRGEKNYNEKVDVYAFAMIVYEIIVQKEPLSELGQISPLSLGIKIIQGYRPPIPNFIPDKMKNLINRCWNDDIEKRPSFSQIYDELLSDFSMFGEYLDVQEIDDYIELLKNHQEKPSESPFLINQEIEKLKNEIKLIKKKLESYTASNDQLTLAFHRMHGNIKERDTNEAIILLERSSLAGNSYASYLLGLHYANLENESNSFDTAKQYFERSSEQGNQSGFNGIGFYYEKGYGVKQDYSKAKKYYEKSSKLGNSSSFKNLGNLYYHGKGVEQDYSIAREYYEKSSKLGNSSALNNLGNLYENGKGVDQNYSIAKEYYEKSSELGNSYALINLGLLYEKGFGVKQNYFQAKEYYEKSSKLGNSYALINLGYLYEKGFGVKQNYFQAKEYYEKSSKLGNSYALINLGYLYEKGFGVEQDYSKAKEYYEKSSNLGNSFAFKKLNILNDKH